MGCDRMSSFAEYGGKKEKKMAKRVYVAATRQNEGKTTVCLGLLSAFKKRFAEIGFIKPVG